MTDNDEIIKALRRLEKVIKMHDTNYKNWKKTRHLEMKSMGSTISKKTAPKPIIDEKEEIEKIPA